MPKTYKYRNTVIIFKYVFVIVFLSCLMLTIVNFQTGHPLRFLYLVLAVASLPIIYFLSQLGDTQIILSNKDITYKLNKKTEKILIEDIKKIDVKSTEKFGGYIHILDNDNHQIYISIRLGELDDFIRRLYQILLDINHHESHNEALLDFYKVSIEVKFQNGRLRHILKYFVIYLLLNILYMFATYGEQSLVTLITLFFGYLIICFIAYLMIEIIIYTPKSSTVSLNQFHDVIDQTKASDLLLYAWIVVTGIHLLLIYLLTVL